MGRTTTIIRTDGTRLVLQWEPGTKPALNWLQRAVGGNVELIPGSKHAYANEDGMYLELAANDEASKVLGYQGLGVFPNVMPLLGDVVVLDGIPLNGSSLKDLNPDSLGAELAPS